MASSNSSSASLAVSHLVTENDLSDVRGKKEIKIPERDKDPNVIEIFAFDIDHTDDKNTREVAVPDRVEPWMEQTIIFPSIRPDKYKKCAIVISATIAGHLVRGIYVVSGAETEVMYEHCFNQLDEVVRRNLTEYSGTLTTALGGVVKPIGKIRLPVTIGAEGRFRTLEMTFLVIRANASPNVIFGRSAFADLRAMASTNHGAIKFPTPSGIATMMSEVEDNDDNATLAKYKNKN